MTMAMMIWRQNGVVSISVQSFFCVIQTGIAISFILLYRSVCVCVCRVVNRTMSNRNNFAKML